MFNTVGVYLFYEDKINIYLTIIVKNDFIINSFYFNILIDYLFLTKLVSFDKTNIH